MMTIEHMHHGEGTFRVAGCELRILDIRELSEQDLKEVSLALPRRNERASRFHKPEDRLRCLGAGKLLIEEVGITNEDQLVTGPHGKLTAPDFGYFNLSHSGNYVVIATSAQPVGVDTELVSDRHLSIANRIFTSKEIAWMELSPLQRFYQLWTQKEATMKLDGRGLALDPLTFEMDPCGAIARTAIDGKAVEVTSLLYEENALSVAVYPNS